ncbi:MAG: acyl-CoA thioesterase, partial [Pseudomonadota bacterium]
MSGAGFAIELAVRDYECDLQGVVNHARYLHYLEHARHEFLVSSGLDFATLTAEGVIVVVVRAEVDYRLSLRSGDRMRISVAPRRRSRIRLDFHQTITRLADEKVAVDALITTTA